jgi:hypothetical protein
LNEQLGDRNFVLLGIKYEAAKLGRVDEDSLARIEEQIQAEAGDSWTSNPMIVRGRNAVRAEHNLGPLGETPRKTTQNTGPARLSLWNKLFGG